MPNPPVLKIELSLKDRVIQSYSFTQEKVVVGRDPEADIFIDNTGVSRAHTGIEWVAGGTYVVKDMGSTNGTFLNDKSIRREPLRSGDVITLGKFTLKVAIEAEDDAPKQHHSGGGGAEDFEGTTVLSADQLKRMMAKAEADRQNGAAPPREPAVKHAPAKSQGLPSSQLLIGGLLILLVGVGIGVAFFLLR